MSLNPYAWVRPLLFSLEPEAAHALVLKALAATQNRLWPCAYRAKRVDDPLTLAGLQFPNRVGLAAGWDKNASCIDGLGALGFGFVEVGTVTPVAQSGNPKPRLFRLPKAQALVNRLGFNNAGLAAFVRNVQQSAHQRAAQAQTNARTSATPSPARMVLGLNIGKNASTPIQEAHRDYLIGLDGVYPFADYIAINISSPNTQNLRTLQNDAALDGLLSALTERRAVLAQAHGKRKPLFVKIAPDLDPTQIDLIAQALLRHGVDGVIATNTTLARPGVQGWAQAQEAGGLSGAPLLAASNQVIRQLRSALGANFPIVGVGGILSAQDAVDKIQAGADVVQLYTGLIYQGPALVRQVAQALRQSRTR